MKFIPSCNNVITLRFEIQYPNVPEQASVKLQNFKILEQQNQKRRRMIRRRQHKSNRPERPRGENYCWAVLKPSWQVPQFFVAAPKAALKLASSVTCTDVSVTNCVTAA